MQEANANHIRLADACELLDTHVRGSRYDSAIDTQASDGMPGPKSDSESVSSGSQTRSKAAAIAKVTPESRFNSESKPELEPQPTPQTKSMAASRSKPKSQTETRSANGRAQEAKSPDANPKPNKQQGAEQPQGAGQAKSRVTTGQNVTYREFWQQQWQQLRKEDPNIQMTDAQKVISQAWNDVKAAKQLRS